MRNLIYSIAFIGICMCSLRCQPDIAGEATTEATSHTETTISIDASTDTATTDRQARTDDTTGADKPPLTTACVAVCCDGTRYPAIQLPRDHCSEQNTQLSDLCVNSTLSRIEADGIEAYSIGNACPASCQITCCNGLKLGLGLTKENCHPDKSQLQGICKADGALQRIVYKEDGQEAISQFEASGPDECKGTCDVTCCDGQKRALPNQKKSTCNQTLAEATCGQEQATQARFAGEVQWTRDDKVSCPGTCRVHCCGGLQFSRALPAEQCNAQNQALLDLCANEKQRSEKIFFEEQEVWSNQTPCSSFCSISCCDGKATNVTLPKPDCSASSAALTANCGGADKTHQIFRDGQLLWTNEKPCLLCKILCCDGYSQGATPFASTASECTAQKQASRCKENRYAAIVFHTSVVDNQVAGCPKPGTCSVQCCPGYGSGYADTRKEVDCTTAAMQGRCTNNQYARISFNGVSKGAGNCPAPKTCKIKCCSGKEITELRYEPACNFSTLGANAEEICQDNYQILNIQFDGQSKYQRSGNCPGGTCVVRCCKDGSGKTEVNINDLRNCNFTEMKKRSLCDGKGGIKSIYFNGNTRTLQRFLKANDPQCK